MIGEEKALRLIERVLWMTDEYADLAGRPKSYGTPHRFHRLDIHLIHSIGKNPGINITELSRLHRISKSAVSQAVRKLEKRGLVRRYQLAENRKEMLFDLTEEGQKAFAAHERFHQTFEVPYLKELAAFSAAEAAAVEKLLGLLRRRAEAVRALG
jgi:DNA-binding MarR family transcriptional regulator